MAELFVVLLRKTKQNKNYTPLIKITVSMCKDNVTEIKLYIK